VEGFIPPQKPGVRQFDAYQGGVAHFERKSLNSKTRLADIQDDFAFYHPGLLYSEVPLNGRDPFFDFATLKDDSNLRPLAFVVGKKFVVGFDDEMWGNTLHLMERVYFSSFIAFMNGVVILDPKKKKLWRLKPQEFRISDPSIPGVTDRTIRVVFFALDTNVGMRYFKQSSPEVVELITSVEAAQDTKYLADNMLAGNI
jgi:hypothetical protein